MVGRELEEEKRRVPATSPESRSPSLRLGWEGAARTAGGPVPGAPPCPRGGGGEPPGVRTRAGLRPLLPRPSLRGPGASAGGGGAGAAGRVLVWPEPRGGPFHPPARRLQICVSCTFSLEPLLKSRGSWMELSPGGPLPPQPPPLGLPL